MIKYALFTCLFILVFCSSCSPAAYAVVVESLIGEGPNKEIKHSSFLMAASKGDSTAVEKALSRGVHPDSDRTKTNKKTALNVACEKEHYSVASLLLASGANPNDSIAVFSPIDEAAWSGDLIAYNLMKPYVDMSSQELKDTLLLDACSSVNYSYSDNTRNPRSERLSIAIDLLSLGGNPNYASPRDGASSIIRAADHNLFHIVNLLYSCGANPNYEDSKNRSAVSILQKTLSDSHRTIESVTYELDNWDNINNHIGTHSCPK